MSELNRPQTPGPWHMEGETAIAQQDRGWIAEAMLWKKQDARAIADLPAWIEAHDEWKARAEKAESERDEMIDRYQAAIKEGD